MGQALTRRQAEFVENLVDLNQLLDGPIHYSVLAERIGVSPFTAYDMLRLLEKKGLVRSEYHLPQDRNGPGRAERVFFATAAGREHRRQMLAGRGATAVANLPGLMLPEMCRADDIASGLTADLLARAAAREGVARYGIELVPLVAWRLRDNPARPQMQATLAAVLPADRPATPADLTLFGGTLLGFLAGEQGVDPEWLAELAAHVQRYQAHVRALDPDAAQQLGADIRAALALAWERLDGLDGIDSVDNTAGGPEMAVPPSK